MPIMSRRNEKRVLASQRSAEITTVFPSMNTERLRHNFETVQHLMAEAAAVPGDRPTPCGSSP